MEEENQQELGKSHKREADLKALEEERTRRLAQKSRASNKSAVTDSG